MLPSEGSRTVAQIFPDLSRVAEEGDEVHLSLVALRLCGSTQMIYHLRTHYPSQCEEAASHFDQQQWQFQSSTYLDKLPCQPLLVQVGALPPRRSGAGVRPTLSLRDQAFVGGANLCVAHFTTNEQHFPLSARGFQMANRTQWEYEAAVERLRHRLSPAALAEVDDLLRPWSAVTTTPWPGCSTASKQP